MKKIFMMCLLLTFISVYAQEAKIDINHIGYGKTLNEAIFTIHSTGEVTITNIDFLIDGKLHETIKAVLPPNAGIKTSVYLEPGEHLIEVKTPEGAYDSLNLRISTARQRIVSSQPDEEPHISRNAVIYIALSIVIIIFVIVIWLLIKKPKPKLE